MEKEWEQFGNENSDEYKYFIHYLEQGIGRLISKTASNKLIVASPK